jgi:signal peptidase II
VKPRLALVLFVAAVCTIGCDGVTKRVASSTLAGSPAVSLLADTVRLEYAENVGGFLGLGSGWPPVVRAAVFGVGNLLVLLALAAVAPRLGWSGPALVGVALFVAGGLSNVVDRLGDGRVIDFLNVGFGPLRTGIFNVADMAIMLGAILVLVSNVRQEVVGGDDQRRVSRR